MTSWHCLDWNSPLCCSGHPHRAVAHDKTCERPLFFWQVETGLMSRSYQIASDVPVTELQTWICLSESRIKFQYKEMVSFKGGDDAYNVQAKMRRILGHLIYFWSLLILWGRNGRTGPPEVPSNLNYFTFLWSYKDLERLFWTCQDTCSVSKWLHVFSDFC